MSKPNTTNHKPLTIFDAHLDLAWNAVSFDRDIAQELANVNERDSRFTDHPSRGNCTVSLPEMRKAGVHICVATILARSGPSQVARTEVLRTDLDFATPEIANANAKSQLAYYKTLDRKGEIQLITSASELRNYQVSDLERETGTEDRYPGTGSEDQNSDIRNLKSEIQTTNHKPLTTNPIGVLLSMEGTDPILSPDDASWWYDQGLRAAGLTHYGQGQHAYGTDTEGPISESGKAILRAFEELGIALDVTHLSDQSMAEAFELFPGPVLASHHNSRTLVPAQRQLSDWQIGQIFSRKGVIGVALDAWMLYPDYQRGVTSNNSITLETLSDHIDYICQRAGNAKQVGIGSDLDGGFGTEQTPSDLKTICDLQKLEDILSTRNYSNSEISDIFSGNWIRFYLNSLPE